jgi:hypothetical protein
MADYEVSIAGFRFDPARDVPQPLQDAAEREGFGSDDMPRPYLVQLHETLDRHTRAALVELGLSLQDYYPDRCYLEVLTRSTAERVAGLEAVRAVLPFTSPLKVDPTIGQREFVTEERRAAGNLLLVVCFASSPIEELTAAFDRLAVEVRSFTLDPEDTEARFIVGVDDMAVAPQIAELAAVRSVEEVGDITLNNGTTSWVVQSNVSGSRPLWAKGLRGDGQIVGHIDGALDLNHCFFRDAVNNTPGPAHRKVVAARNVNGGTKAASHGTFSAGNAAGEDVGADALSATPNAQNGNAPRARLSHSYLYDMDWLGGTLSFLNMLRAQASDGAFIHTNSWDDKSTSAYTQLSEDVDRFTWNAEDHLVIIGPDNGGTIRPPDTSKNALVVNATEQSPNQGSFASGIKQFSQDGRRKPDVMAPGDGIMSADDGTQCGVRTDSGTSFAAPAVAGVAAMVRQYYQEGWYPTGSPQPHHGFTPSGALLKATLINGTVDAAGIPGYPAADSEGEGWGRVLVDDALTFDQDLRNSRVWDVRNADGLTTGEMAEFHVDVVSTTLPLKLVLAWTDPPGAANSSTPVVNNLNLTVVSPGGAQTFLGNVFANGESTTGGSADELNNVEVVLVNSPPVGDWTVRVTAAEVNVGDPGQGFAVVASGELAKAPPPTGTQDVLVVRAMFSDVASTPPLPNLQNLLTGVNNYISSVSYGQATVVPAYRGPVVLDHPKDYYYHPDRNVLIELTEEIVTKLTDAEPALFTTIERLLIVTNDINFIQDCATTGPWPYALPTGFTRPISVSVHSFAGSLERFTHGALHHFGLVDLYAHQGVAFPRPYVDEWDHMGGVYNNVHPLVWSKERAGWLTAHGDTITYIPRPPAGASYNGANPLPLFYTTSAATNRKAIALGLTQGRAQLSDENAFYYVEARDNSATPYDSTLPASGVLVYYVNESVPQGEGPVILRDRNLMTMALADAVYQVGDVVDIPGTGITLTVQAGTGGAPFAINVAYTPPVTDYNVSITRGDTINGSFYGYFSPDIWVDSPKSGFNLGGGPPPHDQRENPVAGLENRIYARVSNAGPATAFDFDVRFRISEPYHTVGGEADFDKFVGIRHIATLPPGSTDVFVPWTPVSGSDPHACVLVDLINLVGTDTNPNDNSAQENLHVVTSVTASPFHPVTSAFRLTNPFDRSTLFYFRIDGAPDGWTVETVPRKIRLDPGQEMAGTVTMTPPPDAEVCTTEFLTVTSWVPRGDTLINVGGQVVQVDLRRATTITFDAHTGRCDGGDWERLMGEMKEQGREPDIELIRRRCARIEAHGCLDPPVAGVEAILKYLDPLGKVTYRTVTTDSNGCLEDFMVSTVGGTWQASAEFPGSKCEGPVVSDPVTVCACPHEQ